MFCFVFPSPGSYSLSSLPLFWFQPPIFCWRIPNVHFQHWLSTALMSYIIKCLYDRSTWKSFFFFKFFDVDHFLSLFNLLQYCFCFYVLFFGREACGILAPQPGIEPTPLALEGEVLITGLPGKSLKVLILRVTQQGQISSSTFLPEWNSHLAYICICLFIYFYGSNTTFLNLSTRSVF